MLSLIMFSLLLSSLLLLSCRIMSSFLLSSLVLASRIMSSFLLSSLLRSSFFLLFFFLHPYVSGVLSCFREKKSHDASAECDARSVHQRRGGENVRTWRFLRLVE